MEADGSFITPRFFVVLGRKINMVPVTSPLLQAKESIRRFKFKHICENCWTQADNKQHSFVSLYDIICDLQLRSLSFILDIFASLHEIVFQISQLSVNPPCLAIGSPINDEFPPKKYRSDFSL